MRLSVTDRCNLRCAYCMPEEEYTWLPSRDILSFEEISSLVDVFCGFGVDKVRLTGGEPLLRRELHRLVRLLSEKPPLKDLAITTNGLLLSEQAAALKSSGLHRVTVSLDTLKRDRFLALTRRDALSGALEGVEAALRAGFAPLKLDAVIIRGTNDDELFDLLEYARERRAEIRFIEYMDVGGATRWSPEQVVPREELLARLEQRYGQIEPLPERTSAPAERFSLRDGTVFGIIASTTAPFCGSCDRSRLTADGIWYLCLYAAGGTDLKHPLRNGAGPKELRELLSRTWTMRTDRGAEQRLSMRDKRQALLGQDALRGNPHLEMHTRGG
ncbi:MAG: GTP 3',8-cyclase MoaA [Myxococcales bacterium]|nr:GTP 3',8-cyclase MoaA [Myxococcales bacterium]